jgi:hypothetical protein
MVLIHKKVDFMFVLLCTLVIVACNGGETGGPGNKYNTRRDKAAGSGWGTPEMIVINNTLGASGPKIDMDQYGNAVAVWVQTVASGDYDTVWSNRYINGTGWDMPKGIDIYAGNASNVQIDVASNGMAVAVWHQKYKGYPYDILTNHFDPAVGWRNRPGQPAFGHADSTMYPAISLDESGNAVVAWYEIGIENHMWANRYINGVGWDTEEIIDSESGDMYILIPQMDGDIDGNVFTVWHHRDSSSDNKIWANRYVKDVGWGTPEMIATNNTETVFDPQIAVNSSGFAMAVWQQYSGTQINLWANTYEPGFGWNISELIEFDDSGNVSEPRIVMDENGNAIVVWKQPDGSRVNIWANTYRYGVGWGSAEKIDSNISGKAVCCPQIAMDSNGNAVVIWEQSDDGRVNIWANTYKSGSGWGLVELVEFNNSGDAHHPDVALDDNGNAIAVWEQSDGTLVNIWANRRESIK